VTGATDDIKINAASFAGVSTSSPLDASSTAIGISGNPSVSITTTTSSDLVVATLMRYSTTNATSNRTSIYRDSTSQSLGAASYQLATSSGSYSDTYTGSVAQDWSMMISAFKAGMTVGSGGSSSSTASTTIRYVLADTLGGSNIVTDASGTVVETLDYYPYGAARLDTKTGSYVGEKRKFDSMERDSGSGLDYAQARYYDSSRGQFISEDPVFWGNPKSQNLTDPQSFNSYAFANGNPIARSDPTGLGAFDYTKGFFTGTGVYLREGVSGLNPFSVQTAYAPANQMSTVQPTKISTAPATNQSFNNGFTAGLDYTDKFSKVVSTIGFVVPIIGGSEVAAGLSQLQLNQLRGSAFEGQKFGELVQDYPGLQPQVTLQTQSGVTTRIDFMAQDTSGNYCLFECKSSPTAPLTKNQTLAFPEIQKSGATVLGNGKAGFPGGTQIPPTTVKVIRP
jgi:RHS repeat-associated protein